jgi:hypothetical protein
VPGATPLGLRLAVPGPVGLMAGKLPLKTPAGVVVPLTANGAELAQTLAGALVML